MVTRTVTNLISLGSVGGEGPNTKTIYKISLDNEQDLGLTEQKQFN